MDISRRDFLVKGVKIISGSLVAGTMLSSLPGLQGLARAANQEKDWERIWQEHEWVYLVDTRKCIGCGRCVQACKLENEVPIADHVFRTWVEQYGLREDGGVTITSPNGGLDGFKPGGLSTTGKSFFVPKLCNQCEKPPCVKVCPVGATYRTGDGVVLVDRERCIGCGYCIQACPYGARFMHPELRVADKCTWCYHRITRGLLPACVQVCPVGARVFGDLKAAGNPVQDILNKERIQVLKPAMGTEPVVYYLGLDRVVV